MSADEVSGEAQGHDAPPEPNAALKSLAVMVGAWDLEGSAAGSNGDINGRLSFERIDPGPEYVREVDDGTLTIWGGEVGSPANFKGTFSDDRNTISGRWEWPRGGYSATLTRAGSG